jgi:hypothetical protein
MRRGSEEERLSLPIWWSWVQYDSRDHVLFDLFVLIKFYENYRLIFDSHPFVSPIANPPNVRERVMRANEATAINRRRAITARARATSYFPLPSSPILFIHPRLPRSYLFQILPSTLYTLISDPFCVVGTTRMLIF